MIPKFVLVVAVVATFLVPGCAAPNQATYSCTPEAGGEPYACVKEQYDLMVERNKLYAEAEAVYRKVLAEDEAIYRSGGTDTPSSVLLETTTGGFQTSRMTDYRTFRENQAIAVGGRFELVWLKRVPGKVIDASIVTMQFCADATSVTVLAPGQPSEHGLVVEETAFFVREDGSMKIGNATSEDVAKC